MITLKQAFEDLHDRIAKQLAESLWEKERTEPLTGQEFSDFSGEGADKKKVMQRIDKDIKERQRNLKVVESILKRYGDNRRTK